MPTHNRGKAHNNENLKKDILIACINHKGKMRNGMNPIIKK